MVMKAKKDWGIGLISMQRPKGKTILYNMRIGKQQELDLEASINEFSSDTTSRFDEEYSISESSDSSIEIMGVTICDPYREGLLNDLDVSHTKPLVEGSEI